MPTQTHTPSRRPFGLVLLTLIYLGLALLGWLRMEQAFQNWAFLNELGIQPGPLYLAVSGAIWGFVASTASIGLWTRAHWSYRAAQMAGVLLSLAYWIDRLWITQPSLSFQNWPFEAGFTVFGLGINFWLIHRLVRRGSLPGAPNN